MSTSAAGLQLAEESWDGRSSLPKHVIQSRLDESWRSDRTKVYECPVNVRRWDASNARDSVSRDHEAVRDYATAADVSRARDLYGRS